MATKHLYRGKGTEEREKLEFEKEYEAKGKTKGESDLIYYKTVGKVKRQRAAKRMRARRK